MIYVFAIYGAVTLVGLYGIVSGLRLSREARAAREAYARRNGLPTAN